MSGSRPGGPGHSGSLPSDFVREGHKRLAALALVYGTVYLIAAFVMPRIPAEEGRFFSGDVLDQVLLDRLGVLFIASSVAFFFLIRRGWLPTRVLNIAGLVFLVYGAIGIEMGVLTWNGDPALLPMGLSWTSVWIVSFPLFVPVSPMPLLWASLLAASLRPLLLALLWMNGIPMPDIPTLVQLTVPTYLCVGIAALAATVVYKLGRDVAEARRLGSYRLVRKLGEGGMGEVWVAEHAMLARPAAIKLVRSDLTAEPHITERFQREVQATAQLCSPHTIAIYDYGVTQTGTFYYVMELLDGIDLERAVSAHGPLSVPRVIRILRQACHSLAEAHECGIVHRDIKPANVFLCRYGGDVDFVKVLDFGLVKRDGSEPDSLMLTRAHTFMGTPTYASPEMARGESDVDGRSDIYALACVAYWLLTGRHVFEASTPMDMLVKHAGEPPEPPSSFARQTVPPELDRILMECLEKDRERRVASARVLGARLALLESDHPWDAEEAARWWSEADLAASPSAAGGAGSTSAGGLVMSRLEREPVASQGDGSTLAG